MTLKKLHYRQCPPRRVKYTQIIELEKCGCVSSVITIAAVLNIEREKIYNTGILLIIDDGVYVCICTVYSYVLKKITQHAFFYDSHFSKKEKSERCGAIIDYRSYSPICVMEGKDIKRKAALKNMLRKIFDGK